VKHPDQVKKEQLARAALRVVKPAPETWLLQIRKRNGEKFWRRAGKSLAEARERVQSYFAADERDEIESAWIKRVS